MTAHKRRHTTQPFALCKLSYAVFRWYGYEHMDMILARFRFMNLDTLILAQLSDHLSDILFDLSVYDLSPVFRCEYNTVLNHTQG